MAIIYTYPDIGTITGTELLICSDVDNENATRSMTTAAFGAYIQSTWGPSSNIYQADGSLVSNRTLSGDANYLHLDNLSNFTVNSTNAINLNPAGGAHPTDQVIIGDNSYITVDNPSGGLDVIVSRSNPTTKVSFSSTGGMPGTPDEISLEGTVNAYLIAHDPAGFVGITCGSATGFLGILNGVPELGGANNNIADITQPKHLVTKEWVEANAITGSGTNNYVSRWTPSGLILGDSTIQDDGSSIGIGIAPASVVSQVLIEGTNPSCITAQNVNTSQSSVGLVGLAYGVKVTPTTHYNVGVYGLGSASDYANYGIIGLANTSIAPPLSSGEFVGGYFRADGTTTTNYGIYADANVANASDNIGLYVRTTNIGAGDHYSIQLVDGTEAAGRVLTSNASGQGSWAPAPSPIAGTGGIYGGSGAVSLGDVTVSQSHGSQVRFETSGPAVGVLQNAVFIENTITGSTQNVSLTTSVPINVMGQEVISTLSTIGTHASFAPTFNTDVSILGGVYDGVVNDTNISVYGYNEHSTVPTQIGVLGEVTGNSGNVRSVAGHFDNTSTNTGVNYGVISDVSGAGVVNTGGYFAATNGTSNYALVTASGGNVGFGTTAPDPCAVVEIVSPATPQGFLPPRMSTADKTTLAATAVEGLIVYDTGLSKLCVFTGAAWETITSV